MPRASLKQRKDGRYCAKYKGRQFLGATQTEAYQKRDAYKKQLDAGLRAEADGVLLGAYALQWINTYKANLTLRPKNDTIRILNGLIDTVGNVPLRSVYPIDIQRVYNLQAGKSKSHIRKVTQTVNALFASAVNNRLITVNPCVGATPPKGEEGTHRSIEEWERDLILRSSHRLTPVVMIMLYAGLRKGEALAINIDRDVDFEKKTITVREAVRFEYNQPILVDPKTEAGIRTVPLLDVLAGVLRPLHGLAAPAHDGVHMSGYNISRLWESYLRHLETLLNGDEYRWYGRRKGQDENYRKEHPWRSVNIRFHDLRHSYCTMLYDSDVDLKTAMKWMGHADQTMILRIYTHLTHQRELRSETNLRKAAGELPGMQSGMQSQ